VKETGGTEKGLLRVAAAGLLLDSLLSRRTSIYPGAADPAYAEAVDAQMRDLLAQPDTPVFTLISPGKLAAAYAADPPWPATRQSSRAAPYPPRSCSTSTNGCTGTTSASSEQPSVIRNSAGPSVSITLSDCGWSAASARDPPIWTGAGALPFVPSHWL
jgi:hypothetical protein